MKLRISLLPEEGFIFFAEVEFQKQVKSLKIIMGERGVGDGRDPGIIA
jgi:hypothetical protein